MYHIAIPSFQRYDCVTLSLLSELMERVTVFVADEDEYTKYREKHPDVNIVVGVKGIGKQRNFITNYYNNDDIIVSMDDDIQKFLCQDRPVKTMLDFCVNYLSTSKLGMMGFPPTSNEFYNKRDSAFTEGRYLAVGVFHIYKNDKTLQLSVEHCEDYERSCQYINKYGEIIRCWDVCYKHKPLAKGGLTEFRADPDNQIITTNKLLYTHPEILDYKYRKNSELPQLRIGAKRERPKVIQLPYTDIFNQLLSLMDLAKLRSYRDVSDPNVDKSSGGNRLGFPSYKGGIFGKVRERIGGAIKLEGALCRDNPVLWAEIKRIGEQVCPFPFTSVQVNRDLICPPHKDRSNVGDSMLVSFGDYEGCNIMIDGKEYDARKNPLVFNGSMYEHYNTPKLSGTKYSLVYFSM